MSLHGSSVPVYKDFNLRYHWSVMQAEYATDIVFKKQERFATESTVNL